MRVKHYSAWYGTMIARANSQPSPARLLPDRLGGGALIQSGGPFQDGTTVEMAFVSASFPCRLKHLAVLHHKRHILQHANIFERIGRNGDHVGIGSRSDRPDFALHVEKFGGARSC